MKEERRGGEEQWDRGGAEEAAAEEAECQSDDDEPHPPRTPHTTYGRVQTTLVGALGAIRAVTSLRRVAAPPSLSNLLC